MMNITVDTRCQRDDDEASVDAERRADVAQC